jgi:HSP20 family protein
MNTATTSHPVTATTPAPPAERIRYVTPAVAIYADADGYTIEAEMPGVGKEGIHITVENGELVFTGAKTPQPAGQRLYGETSRADYRRVFDLDPAVDTDHITARMDQGVLVLRLPKAQDKKPRRITVGD